MVRFSLLLLTLPISIWSVTISDYRIAKGCFITDEGTQLYSLRAFKKGTSSYRLMLNDMTLKTEVLREEELLEVHKCDMPNYDYLKSQALVHAKPLHNAGITHGFTDGFALTVDMCPSRKKGYERELFISLMKHRKALPVAVCMTRDWIRKHYVEFAELKQWDQNGSLDITWINHGYRHPYVRKRPLERNFLNMEGVNFKRTVLDMEKMLLSYDVIPSIFFRFPGLVSSKAHVDRLIAEFGVIPIGSKAWLAKGEKVTDGSIVLIHGNGNEFISIKKIDEVLRNRRVVDLSRLLVP